MRGIDRASENDDFGVRMDAIDHLVLLMTSEIWIVNISVPFCFGKFSFLFRQKKALFSLHFWRTHHTLSPTPLQKQQQQQRSNHVVDLVVVITTRVEWRVVTCFCLPGTVKIVGHHEQQVHHSSNQCQKMFDGWRAPELRSPSSGDQTSAASQL